MTARSTLFNIVPSHWADWGSGSFVVVDSGWWNVMPSRFSSQFEIFCKKLETTFAYSSGLYMTGHSHLSLCYVLKDATHCQCLQTRLLLSLLLIL